MDSQKKFSVYNKLGSVKRKTEKHLTREYFPKLWYNYIIIRY